MASGNSTSRKNAPIFLNPSYCFQSIFQVRASGTIPSSWRVIPPESVVKNSFALVSSFADNIKDANQKLEGLKCSSTLRNGQLSQCSRLFSSWHNMGSWDQPWIHQCRNKGIYFHYLFSLIAFNWFHKGGMSSTLQERHRLSRVHPLQRQRLPPCQLLWDLPHH